MWCSVLVVASLFAALVRIRQARRGGRQTTARHRHRPPLRSQRRRTRTIAAGSMRARRVMACGSDVGARAWRSSSASTHSAPRAAARIRPGACHLHADRIDPRPIPPHARAPCRTELARSARTPRSRRCWRGAVRECAWCVVELSGWATRRRRTEGRAPRLSGASAHSRRPRAGGPCIVMRDARHSSEMATMINGGGVAGVLAWWWWLFR